MHCAHHASNGWVCYAEIPCHRIGETHTHTLAVHCVPTADNTEKIGMSLRVWWSMGRDITLSLLALWIRARKVSTKLYVKDSVSVAICRQSQ